MNTQELKLAAMHLKRLFNSFQPSGQGDADGQAEAYLWAVKEYALIDVEAAVTHFCQGFVVSYTDPRCPSTGILCQEIRARQKARETREANAAQAAKVIPIRPANHWLTKYEADRGQSQGNGA